MSKLMFKTWPTFVPRLMPRSPGAEHTRLATFLWVTSTPFGVPVVPADQMSVKEDIRYVGGGRAVTGCEDDVTSMMALREIIVDRQVVRLNRVSLFDNQNFTRSLDT